MMIIDDAIIRYKLEKYVEIKFMWMNLYNIVVNLILQRELKIKCLVVFLYKSITFIPKL